VQYICKTNDNKATKPLILQPDKAAHTGRFFYYCKMQMLKAESGWQTVA